MERREEGDGDGDGDEEQGIIANELDLQLIAKALEAVYE